MNTDNQVSKIFEKIKLYSPIDEQIQSRIAKSMKPNLYSILKKNNSYSLFYKSVISLYLFFKHRGIKIKFKTISRSLRGMQFATGMAAFASAAIIFLNMFTIQSYTNKGLVTFVTGQAQIVKADGIKSNLLTNTEIDINDKIITGEKTTVMLQLDQKDIIVIRQNSELVFTLLDSKGSTELNLSKGTVISKVQKLLKSENSFSIKTPTVTAAVRGTDFKVSYINNISSISVTDGKIEIIPSNSSKDSEIVNIDETIMLSEKIEKIKITEYDKTEISIVEQYIIDDPKNIDETIIKQNNSKITPKLEAIEEELQSIKKAEEEKKKKEKITYESLLEEYGKLDIITTYRGRRYKGVVISRSASAWILLTPNGKRRISKNDIKNTSIIK